MYSKSFMFWVALYWNVLESVLQNETAGFKPQSYHSLAVWPLASYLTLQTLGFPIYKVGLIDSNKVVATIKWDHP